MIRAMAPFKFVAVKRELPDSDDEEVMKRKCRRLQNRIEYQTRLEQRWTSTEANKDESNGESTAENESKGVPVNASSVSEPPKAAWPPPVSTPPKAVIVNRSLMPPPAPPTHSVVPKPPARPKRASPPTTKPPPHLLQTNETAAQTKEPWQSVSFETRTNPHTKSMPSVVGPSVRTVSFETRKCPDAQCPWKQQR